MSSNPFRQGHTRSSSLPSSSAQDPRYQQQQQQQQLQQQQQRYDQANAHRKSHSHHNRRRRHSNRVQPDSIDKLDNLSGVLYHHEGPYDAASSCRNRSSKHSPVEALKSSNEEILRATPHENIVDSLTKHRPLDGVAFYPPGTTDWTGRRYDYKEGHNMMTEDRGNFRRWPGMVRTVSVCLLYSSSRC